MESKIDATHRLRREGRWQEASLYRDEVRKQLRSEGRKRQEANEAAWEAMFENYPPVADEAAEEVTGDDPAEIAELAARSKGRQFDMARDTEWVYGHLSDDDVTPLDAPSLGAWGMLGVARENQQWFYVKFFPSMIAAQGQSKRTRPNRWPDEDGPIPLGDDVVERENQSLQEIRRVLREIIG